MISSSPPCTRKAASAGFTLIEVLVACSIMALLLVVIAQIINMTSGTVRAAASKTSSVMEARFFLDRISSDLEHRVKRDDIATFFEKKVGNDRVLFFSEVAAYTGDRLISGVSYQVNEDVGDRYFRLERGVEGITWSGSTAFTFDNATLPTVQDANFEIIADNIFRFEFTFLKKDGSISNLAASNLSDVSAVIVAVATVDGKLRTRLGDSALSLLSSRLPDAEENVTPIITWKNARDQHASFASGLPTDVVNSVRFYQRYYYVR